MKTKRIKTPDDMPQLCSRVGTIYGGRCYELPDDIADDLVKTRGAVVQTGKDVSAERKATRRPDTKER